MNRDRFYLIVVTTKEHPEPRGVPIARSKEADGDDFGRLYDAWRAFFGFSSRVEASTDCVDVWQPDITPQKLPYTYSHICEGGLYHLWNLGLDTEAVKQSEAWLRHSFDVVTLSTYDVTLVDLGDWSPPSPFQVIALPDWVAHPTPTAESATN